MRFAPEHDAVRLRVPGVLGTVAGDDTMLVVADEKVGALNDDSPGMYVTFMQSPVVGENGKLPVEFTGDRVRLRRALANLVDNALKYLGEGRLIILSADATDREVVLRVQDDGLGITAEEMFQKRKQTMFFEAEAIRVKDVADTFADIARQAGAAPDHAPCGFGGVFLHRHAEVVDVLHRLVDVFRAEHFTPQGDPFVEQFAGHV